MPRVAARSRRLPTFAARWAILALIAACTPLGLLAQTPSLALHAGLAGGPSNFAALGISVAADVGIAGPLRVVAQWTDWQALGGCGVADAASECNARAGLWELGLRHGLAVSPRVTPYVGAGLGVYRRSVPSRDDDPTHSPYLSLAAGFDFRTAAPFAIRFGLVHQELFDDRVERAYRTGVRFTGMLIGVAVSVR